MPDSSCGAVVLAAGSSSRLGEPKQLVQIGGGSLLRRTVRMAKEAGCDPVVVVLGFEAERMRGELDGLRATAIVNAGWREGMGSSLRCGVAALMDLEPRPANILLLVCDQVALSSDFLSKLLRVHGSVDGSGGAGITAARYAGRLGVPAIFSSALFPELMAIEGDRGAGGILEENASRVTAVDFPGGELDLDTPEQLGRLV